MPRRNIPPPPFPTFLLQAFLVITEVFKKWLASSHLPPPFPAWMVHFIVSVHSYLSLSQSLMQSLFPWFRPTRNKGRDYYNAIKEDPRKVWYNTGETIESFEDIVHTIGWEVSAPRCVLHQPRTNRRRRCLLDIHNRILLVLIWLRTYPTYAVLAADFCISITTVYEEIYHVVPILFLNYQRFVSWPNLVQWAGFVNTWHRFPNMVGLIDGTIHRIQRPTGPSQREFYRRDKKCHFISSQVVIDPTGMIVLIVSGFPGHLNDAQTYRMIPSIGPNGICRLPRQCRLGAYKGYAARRPLIRAHNARNRRTRDANKELRRIRAKIENSIGYFKVYQAISSVFRHKRPFLPIVVQTCANLSNRKRYQLRRLAR